MDSTKEYDHNITGKSAVVFITRRLKPTPCYESAALLLWKKRYVAKQAVS